ncbi:hypothetical protein MMC13_004021 [Lambiella insularis]|nr:hypothetical protein [Lambiella insularis]
MPLSISHYLNNMPLLTDQWNPYNYKEHNRQRIYLKDIDCPSVWHDKLKEQIPPGVFYLNDSTGEAGGPGSVDELNPHGLGLRKGRGVARAGDLMSCLPQAMRAENMMCYIGHEGTYTPAHREMCASLGQNIMVETSSAGHEDGKPTKPGSSIWFMTETKDRHLVSEYWLSTLGHDIEVESHFAQINAWKAAPFTTYIVEQKVGDFLLIPPLAPHQVWNRGTRTMKAAWNRTTVETLEMALNEALPRARLVCRDEQYKNKAIVLFSLQRYSGILRQAELQKQTISDAQQLLDLTYSPKIRQLKKDFRRLFALYTQILLSEMFTPASPPEKRMQYLPYDSNVTCSYCRCNIFNRFLTCPTCVAPMADGDQDTYDICLECYAMGRSCRCLSKLKWVEQFPWKDLVEKHDLWRSQILAFETGVTDSLPSLDLEKQHLMKKTLAEICQEQLKLRPWRDPKKGGNEDEEAEVEETVEVDEVNNDGTIKKKPKKRRSEKWLQDNVSCHICVTRSAKWKHAICGCGLAFCYGVLWRGFDMMPQTVMEDRDWKCPRCLKICPCSTCRKAPSNKPFEPKGTVLGHDTKKFADPRSVESLVDFSHSNIHWVKKAGDDHPHETRRLRRHQDEARLAKSRDPNLNEHYVDDDDVPSPSSGQSGINPQRMLYDEIPIDPNLDPSLGPPLQPTSNQMPGVDTRAPVANMVNKPDGTLMQNAAIGALQTVDDVQQTHGSFVGMANGISYEYPDPTVPSLSPQANHYSHPQPVHAHKDYDEPCAVEPKRKRKTDRPLIRSDLPALPVSNDSIGNKLTGSGKQKLIKLHINGSRLAEVEANFAVRQASKDQAMEIIASDLPLPGEPIGAISGKVQAKKRKWTRGAVDDDFSTRKRRKPSQMTSSKGRGTLQVDYAEHSETDIEDEVMIELDEPVIVGAKQNRRSLPAYLARRSPVDTSELPKELSTEPSHKVRRKNNQLSVDSRPSTSNAGEEPPPPVPKAIIQPGATADSMATLNAIATKVTDNHTADLAEANRKAKLKAVRWSEGFMKSLESESDSGESLIELTSPKRSSVGKLTTAEKRSPKPIDSSRVTPTKVAKKSIFSRPGIGKIKITSAKSPGSGKTAKINVITNGARVKH